MDTRQKNIENLKDYKYGSPQTLKILDPQKGLMKT